jgi:DNA-binding Lrp family transcriptional regulator
MTPQEVWAVVGVSRQAAARRLKPLLEAKLIQRVGSRKTGRFILG